MKNETTTKDEKNFSWLHFLKYGFVIIIVIGGLFLYSHFIATHGLKIKEYKIVSSQITDTFHGLKIVHFSDIHYGITTTEKDLNNIQEKINNLNPDIVVFTGDLFDQDIEIKEEDQEILTEFLKGINANISKYAITGEDDYSIASYPIILENGGFINLDEKYDMIYNKNYESIFIAGLSTNLQGTKNAKDKLIPAIEYLNSFTEVADENGNITSNNQKPTYTILIMHEPDDIDSIDYGKFDLVLAGHNHGGQIRLPLIGGLLLQDHASHYRNGHYTLNNTEFYISSGIGTTKIPFRLWNRPSINFYRLTNH